MSGTMPELTLSDVARRLDVSPATLRRWVKGGIVPLGNGRWTPAAVAHARIVARLRERGYSLEQLREAAHAGRLAYGYLEDCSRPPGAHAHARGGGGGDRPRAGADRADLDRGRASRPRRSSTHRRGGHAAAALHAAVLDAGFPLVAFLQLVRVYGQALAQIADAEVKLFHLFVHEPLMRDGVPGLEIAEEMEGLAARAAPARLADHGPPPPARLQHFVGQDVVGHLELRRRRATTLGRLRVAIAFADLAGYTRLTEEAGEEEAVDGSSGSSSRSR